MASDAEISLTELERQARAAAASQACAAESDDARWLQDPVAAVHEMRVHQIELEMQNEALRQANMAMEVERARYLELFEMAPIGYCAIDDQGLIIEANVRVAMLLGLEQNELHHMPLTSLICPEDQDLFYLRRKTLADTAKPQNFELKLLRRGAPPFWADVRVSIAQALDGKSVLRVALCDVNARKQAEAGLAAAADRLEGRVAERTAELARTDEGLRQEIIRRAESEAQLRRSEDQLRAILDAAGAAIITTDQSGTIELFNLAAEQTFGWSAEEILGQNVARLMPSPHRETHNGYLQRHLRSGERLAPGFQREVSGLRKDGTVFPLELRISEIPGQSSPRFTAILRDLTDHQRLEAEFRQAQKMEAIARLSTGIAHDFNNLLMGVIGCCDAAAATLAPTHGATAWVSEIKGAAERGAALTRQLLSYGRPQTAHALPIRLNDVVATVASILKSVVGEDILLEVELCASGGEIWADSNSLEQVLLNLAVNARDAMKQGGKLRIATCEVELTTSERTHFSALAAGQYIQLEVEDSGSGIALDIQKHVFEPFFTTKPVGQGTGLGLYTVYGIVDRLGGAIELTSELGHGTRFAILLPRHAADSVPGPQATSQHTDSVEAPEPLPRQTILVVEDEYLIRFAIKHMLNQDPFDLLMAESFDDAQRVVAQHPGPIDVLLTDIVLPGGSGGALADWLMQLRPALRVVYMSAYPTAVLVEQGSISSGASSLEKPFDEEQLHRAILATVAGAA